MCRPKRTAAREKGTTKKKLTNICQVSPKVALATQSLKHLIELLTVQIFNVMVNFILKSIVNCSVCLCLSQMAVSYACAYYLRVLSMRPELPTCTVKTILSWRCMLFVLPDMPLDSRIFIRILSQHQATTE